MGIDRLELILCELGEDAKEPHDLMSRTLRRSEDEKLLIELEKRYFGKLTFRADPAFHAEQFKIVNVATNEELASVGG